MGVRFGLKIGIRVNLPEFAADVRNCLPPDWQPLNSPHVDHLFSLRLGGDGPRAGSKSFYLLHTGPQQVFRTLDRAEAISLFEGVLQRFIAANARDRAFVHAGVVGWKGRAIVLPGRSFAGKSTLVKALLAEGATYYSDEYAVFDRRGRVHPYSRRLSIRREGLESARPQATELGAEIGTRPIPVGLLVCNEYRASARWQPKPLTAARAMFELAANTWPEVARSRFGSRALERVAVSTLDLSGRRGDAALAAREILRSAEQTPIANNWLLRFVRAALSTKGRRTCSQ